jgi:DNA-binding transcriptional regulator YdaS (Cro superfamily)
MDKLLAYLKTISKDDQASFAGRCGTSVGYIRKACSRKQRIGAEICVAIEQATEGAVTRRDLRPDDWFLIWPELAERPILGHPTEVTGGAA